jgi:hypothetical protein
MGFQGFQGIDGSATNTGATGPTGPGTVLTNGTLCGDYLVWSSTLQNWVVQSNNVTLGGNAGCSNQGTGSVAIGYNAGNSSQGTNAIAIGPKAGVTNQPANSIVLNASSTALNPTSSGMFVNPVRGVTDNSYTGSNIMYNTVTNEVFYNTANPIIGGSLQIVGGSVDFSTTSNVNFHSPSTGASTSTLSPVTLSASNLFPAYISSSATVAVGSISPNIYFWNNCTQYLLTITVTAGNSDLSVSGNSMGNIYCANITNAAYNYVSISTTSSSSIMVQVSGSFGTGNTPYFYIQNCGTTSYTYKYSLIPLQV